MEAPAVLTAVVVGAGPSGICAAVRLREAARVDDFVVVEKNANLSGTWWDNQYPGCGCDVASHLYSFSFELNSEWTKFYSLQPEILGYFERVAIKYRVRERIRFNTEAIAVEWLEDRSLWQVTTRHTETRETSVVLARFVVSCVGGLHIPRYPEIADFDKFQGRTVHTARWDHTIDLAGKNVALVGNAASGIQVAPQIQPVVKQLTIMQRSPNWIMPRHNYNYTAIAKWLFRFVPGLMFLYRMLLFWTCELRFFAFQKDTWLNAVAMMLARQNIKQSVKNKELRSKLVPDYPIGCKRVIVSDDFLQTLEKPNVRLETGGIARATESGLVTREGVTVPADVIVFATGFQVGKVPMTVRGRGGVELDQFWEQRGGPEAYLGMSIPHFPNLLMCLGPSTGSGHNSALLTIEMQVNYICKMVRLTLDADLRSVEVRTDVFEHFNANIQRALSKSVWAAGCTSWYKSSEGHIFAAWPHTTVSYGWATLAPRLRDFVVDGKGAQARLPDAFSDTLAGRALELVLKATGLVRTFWAE